MNPLVAKVVIGIALVLTLVLPASVHRAPAAKVASSRKGGLERVLLALVAVATLLPLVWIATPLLAFADYPLHLVAFASGVVCLALGLWLLHKTHADLGASWSITLELREEHRLVTTGIYARIRHPMYLALLVYALGQALVVPNAVAGPFYLAAILLLVAARIGPEERMMADAFPSDYAAYRDRTKRLIPGVW